MEYSQTITERSSVICGVICGIETNSSNDSRKIGLSASRCYRIILQTEFSRGTRISLIVSQALFTQYTDVFVHIYVALTKETKGCGVEHN